MTSCPPELVPEYPRALYSIQAWSMVMSHTCRQAPDVHARVVEVAGVELVPGPGPWALDEKMPYWAAVASSPKKVEVAVR